MFKPIALVALVAAVLIPAAARAAAHVELTNAAAAVVTRNGTAVTEALHGAAQPGTRVRYTIVAHNTGDRPAASLIPVVKIPAGERFIAGSAGASAEFSVDGGKVWSRQPMVTVTNPGGATTTRPALPSEFNAIRWPVSAPLAPGARLTFAYDVTIE